MEGYGMKKLMIKLGYIRSSGRIDWREIRFDTLAIAFLGFVLYMIYLANDVV